MIQSALAKWLDFSTIFSNAIEWFASLKSISNGVQTVKFGERIPRAKISGLFLVCTKFFDRPISGKVFQPVCCVTHAVFKKGIQILLLPRMARFQYNPCSFALRLDGLLRKDKNNARDS